MRILLSLLLLGLPLSAADRPNILWLTAEDHGPHLGCYGDPDAVTPNLDRFAKRSLLYSRTSSTAPICAPARTTLITGMYAPAIGGQHMRSEVPVPAWLKLYPQLLREQGYYCTNNSKTDYNLAGDDNKIWDESSGKAHYKNRPDGKPFFAIFNITITHESQIRNKNPNPSHDPAKVSIPPYHPDIPEVRKDWAQYHNRISQMDQWFREQIAALEKAGLAENTIVFFYADHGSGMPRSKRYVGWSGLHVPLLVHIPEKFKHLRPDDYQVGGKSDRLVGFVDMAPTLLSLLGQKPAPYHQGHAFLGEHTAPPPEFSFGFVGRADERPDETRSVTDGRYIYIRNFMPHTPLLKGLEYQMETPTTRLWRDLYRAGKLNEIQSFAWSTPRPYEELYDLQNDYFETKNLAAEQPDLVKKFREALAAYFVETHDLGLLPESTFHTLSRQQKVTPADFAKSAQYDPAALFPLTTPITTSSDLSLDPANPQQLAVRLRALLPNGTALLKDNGGLRISLQALLDNDSLEIRAGAAEALTLHPETRDKAIDQLLALADPAKSDPFVALHAMDALSRLDLLTPEQLARLKSTNVKPDKSWPGRVAGYCGRLKSIVAAQFSKN